MKKKKKKTQLQFKISGKTKQKSRDMLTYVI